MSNFLNVVAKRLHSLNCMIRMGIFWQCIDDFWSSGDDPCVLGDWWLSAGEQASQSNWAASPGAALFTRRFLFIDVCLSRSVGRVILVWCHHYIFGAGWSCLAGQSPPRANGLSATPKVAFPPGRIFEGDGVTASAYIFMRVAATK